VSLLVSVFSASPALGFRNWSIEERPLEHVDLASVRIAARRLSDVSVRI
jgi:hypothetical protein